METLYNVYYAGEVLEGQDPGAVRENIARLFKADEATLEKLFSGKLQLLKRDCDRARALQYKQAMERAGAQAIIRAAQQPASADDQPQSRAEKIAAVANAAEHSQYRPTGAAPEPPPAPPEEGLHLWPVGADLLRPEERPASVDAPVQTAQWTVDKAPERLSAPPSPAPPPPDTGHLELDDAGAMIPSLASQPPAPEPDTSALDLSPVGTDFSDCAVDDQTALEVDLSGLELAPGGSDVLEEQYRRRDDVAPPSTDHLSLSGEPEAE